MGKKEDTWRTYDEREKVGVRDAWHLRISIKITSSSLKSILKTEMTDSFISVQSSSSNNNLAAAGNNHAANGNNHAANGNNHAANRNNNNHAANGKKPRSGWKQPHS